MCIRDSGDDEDAASEAKEEREEEVPDEDDFADPAEIDDDSEEAIVPKMMRDPGQPTQREIDEHETAAHQPPRAWCKDCNRGRMQHDHHRMVERQDPPEETAIPCISMDYCFMGNSVTAAKDNPILVVFDNRTKSLGAWQVYRK